MALIVSPTSVRKGSVQRLLVRGLALIAFVSIESSIFAEEWIILGPRAMGLGGAGVAAMRGGYAMYWNPASLGMPPRKGAKQSSGTSSFDVEATLSGSLAAPGNLLPTLPTLSTINSLVDNLDFDNINSKFGSGTQFTQQEIRDTLRLLTVELPSLNERGTGAIGAGASARVWRIGVTALGLGYAGARPIVDFNSLFALGNRCLDDVIGPDGGLPGRTLNPQSQAFADSLVADGLAGKNQAEELVFQAEQAGIDTTTQSFQNSIQDLLTQTQNNNGGDISNAFTNNSSGARVRGILLSEVGVGYGHPIGDWLSIGATIRGIYATTYFKPFRLADVQNADDIIDDLTDTENTEEAFNVALDAGVLVRPLDWLVVGVAGKNLNQPTFDFGGGQDDCELDPQSRVGVAVMPFTWLTLAADIDAFVNHSDVLPGYDTQFVDGGAEVSLWDVLFIRAGASKNLQESAEDTLIHAGLGVRVWYFSLDAAVMFTPSTTNLNTSNDLQEVPERSGFALMLGLNIPI